MANWTDPPVPANISDAYDKYWRAVTGNADASFVAYNSIMRLTQRALSTTKMQELRGHLRNQGLRDWTERTRWQDAPTKVAREAAPEPAPEPAPATPAPAPEPEPSAPVAAPSASETEPAPEAGTDTPGVSTPPA